MSLNFTLYVDESGDQDLNKFRTDKRQHGSDPFLVFGAVLVANRTRDKLREELQDIQAMVEAKSLHCNEMSHLKVAYFARRAAAMRILAFAIVSKKETVGEYRQMISGAKQAEDYYNKCAVYLLERVGDFFKAQGYTSDQLSIVFEEKRHDYQRLRNFIAAIRRRPLETRANSLQYIDPLSVTALAKKDEPLLSLADLTSYAVYQSVNESKSNYSTPEQRYLRELKPKFWRNPKTGQIANHGIKYIKGPFNMGLRGQTLEFALKIYRKKYSAKQK